MTEETKPEYAVRRGGITTSEFWLSVLALAAGTILPLITDEVGKLVIASPFSALAPALIAAGYAISRGLVKKSRNDASATVGAAVALNAGAIGKPLAFQLAADYLQNKIAPTSSFTTQPASDGVEDFVGGETPMRSE